MTTNINAEGLVRLADSTAERLDSLTWSPIKVSDLLLADIALNLDAIREAVQTIAAALTNREDR